MFHAEQVGSGDDGEAFCNILVYADGSSLMCHLAHEASPGQPDILHLEVRHHAQALTVRNWLNDAARLGPSTEAGAGPGPAQAWPALQIRALVSAATAGVLQALEEPGPAARAEPALVARVRVLVENQLSDHSLSVHRLAAQAGCTADYLSHVFKRSSGEHLAASINRQRIERAAHLLGDSTLAGKEIAWACGFASQSYFIRNFRMHFGMTPKAWRAGRDRAEAAAPAGDPAPGLPAPPPRPPSPWP